MKFERPALQVLKKRIKEKRRFIQVLMGPRQVGKTTLVLQLLKGLKTPNLFVSADGVSNANEQWLQQQWQTARLMLQTSEAEDFLLVIDEVQKLSNWSEIVKQLWDEDQRNGVNIKLILLGSSRLLIQQGLTESLAGRFEVLYMSHWSFTEMQEAFGWNENQYVWFGGYPGSAELIEDEVRWKQYVQHSLIETSISKDILMLTRIDKPSLMKRLFELGCSYSGQILSYTKMLGQLDDAGNTTTLAHYLHMLDTAGLLAGIEKVAFDKIRQRSSSPKFQVYNNALISSQRPDTFNRAVQDLTGWGRLVESAVGAHLLNHAASGNFELYYWREGMYEMDFVLRKGDRMVGLEIKIGNTQKSAGIGPFSKKYPKAKLILLGQSGLPWQRFLKMNPVEVFG